MKGKICGDHAGMTIFLAVLLSCEVCSNPGFVAAAKDCVHHLYILVMIFHAQRVMSVYLMMHQACHVAFTMVGVGHPDSSKRQ